MALSSLGSILNKLPVQRRKLRKYTWLVDVLRVQDSIIPKIIGPVLTVTALALAVATVSEVYGHHLNLSNNVLPLLSVVVGLILVFRTSYDRYNEGRKDFGTMTATTRTLSRLIWVHVNLPFPAGDKPNGALSSLFRSGTNADSMETIGSLAAQGRAVAEDRMTAEKIRAVKLLLSFILSVVHYLRNEPGIEYADFEGILPEDFKHNAVELGTDSAPLLLNRYATHAAIDRGRLGHKPSKGRRASFQKRKSTSATGHGDIEPSQTTPLIGDDHTTVEFRARETSPSLPLPLIIAHELTRIIYKFRRRGYIDVIGPSGFNTMNTCVTVLVDQFTALERVATTPIPISYGIHLKQCVTLYLFSLPFTLVQDMHWRMVPLVTLVAFTLMGIEGIADAIEMPFGKETADLPLDRFCEALRSEIEYMIERLPQGPEDDIDPFDT
ncbi:hypothetical protein FRB94_006375 [Tulasnella sp. JGI-2019a]|nr:hypothetical protein FRB93_001890 [Tulasnella sp. JGI-2019a]KAG8999241.1 hypothetical protein FRB94_006375 [Tulasnella sp. JGI-2019a]KAG9026728.1 hypothetical protein FRB95_008534 [Tulasnella sp. JGI-2019a]